MVVRRPEEDASAEYREAVQNGVKGGHPRIVALN